MEEEYEARFRKWMHLENLGPRGLDSEPFSFENIRLLADPEPEWAIARAIARAMEGNAEQLADFVVNVDWLPLLDVARELVPVGKRRIQFTEPLLPSEECMLCQERFHRSSVYHTLPVCRDCTSPRLVKEGARVRFQNYRADKLSMPHTLTFAEWHGTLIHFNWHCAYCSGPFQCMEHYFPVEMAGTIASNCLPSCQRCNIIKRAHLPHTVDFPFSQDVVQRIETYFASL